MKGKFLLPTNKLEQNNNCLQDARVNIIFRNMWQRWK